MYGPTERFASEAAHRNFNRAVDTVMSATGCNVGDAEAMVTAIAAYVMRDYADRIQPPS